MTEYDSTSRTNRISASRQRRRSPKLARHRKNNAPRNLPDGAYTSEEREHFLNEAAKTRINLARQIKSEQIYLMIFVLSLFLSFSFNSFPFWHSMSNPSTSDGIYSGLAMMKGLVPYNDFLGSGGLLFYLINWLGNVTGTTLLLYLFEFLALFLSGLMTYKLVLQNTLSKQVSQLITIFTLVTIAGISQGGDNPVLFALPLALWAVKFLDRYFTAGRSDESFIIYGIMGGLTFTIAPLFSFIWLLSFPALFAHGVKNQRFGNAFYQFLASLFGFLLIGYLIAFYALDAQVLYTSIEQSVIIPLTNFGISNFGEFAMAVVMLLIFSLAGSIFYAMGHIREQSDLPFWHSMLILGALVVMVLTLFTKELQPSNLLALIPFMVIFSGRQLTEKSQEKGQLLGTYLSSHFFLPAAAIIFVIGQPVVSGLINAKHFAAEHTIAKFIKENSKSSDRAFVMADDKNISIASGHVSALNQIPKSYPVTYHQAFELRTMTVKEKFVVIQDNQKVPANLKNTLKTNYKKVKSYSGFTIYQYNK